MQFTIQITLKTELMGSLLHNIRLLTTTCNSSSRASDALFWDLIWYTYKHTDKVKRNKSLNKGPGVIIQHTSTQYRYSHIQLNREKVKRFPLKSGPRQGWPLFLPLVSIVLQVQSHKTRERCKSDESQK